MSSTSKRLLILLGITTVAAGGYVAYRYYTKKKNEQQTDYISINNEPVEAVEEPEVEEVEQPEKFIFGDNISKMPEFTEIEKTEYSTRALAYAAEKGNDTNDPFVIEKSEDADDEEAFEAMKVSKEYDAYVKKNKNKIIVLPEGEIEYTWNREIGNDPENPDVCYEEEELYYFTEDETLTDEDGNIIDEEQYLGVKPRQFGWFTNTQEDIYIRNNPLERDFRVNKVPGCKEDYFP